MKTIKNPNSLLYWKGRLVKVTSIAEGKTIFMVDLNTGEKHDALEHSPLFQENAEPVDTLEN